MRAAVRLLFRRPGFCAAIILTLAIALGAASAIFNLLYAMVLRPLPFPAADRLVAIDALVGGDQGRLTLREYRELARDTRTFEGWGATSHQLPEQPASGFQRMASMVDERSNSCGERGIGRAPQAERLPCSIEP